VCCTPHPSERSLSPLISRLQELLDLKETRLEREFAFRAMLSDDELLRGALAFYNFLSQIVLHCADPTDAAEWCGWKRGIRGEEGEGAGRRKQREREEPREGRRGRAGHGGGAPVSVGEALTMAQRWREADQAY